MWIANIDCSVIFGPYRILLPGAYTPLYIQTLVKGHRTEIVLYALSGIRTHDFSEFYAAASYGQFRHNTVCNGRRSGKKPMHGLCSYHCASAPEDSKLAKIRMCSVSWLYGNSNKGVC